MSEAGEHVWVDLIGFSEGVEAELRWRGSEGQYVVSQAVVDDDDVFTGEYDERAVGADLSQALSGVFIQPWAGVRTNLSRAEFCRLVRPESLAKFGRTYGLHVNGLVCELVEGRLQAPDEDFQ